MSIETDVTPEQRKEQWLAELSEFIVEANGKTWAAEGAEVEPQRPGYQELEYRNGLWLLRDSYTGYFRAPGMTTVYYNDTPAWTMQYGGHGQSEGHESHTKQTFNFLKAALMKVTVQLPFRGPEEYVEGDNTYHFTMLSGDINEGLWREEITENGELTFTQTGLVGTVIGRDSERQPVYPWNLQLTVLYTNLMATITICSSANFYRQAVDIQEKLEKLGYKVIMSLDICVTSSNNHE